MKQAAIRKFSKARIPPLPTDNANNEAKLSVPGPTTPWHFFSLLLFSTLRRPMSVDPMTKAGLYLCAAAGGSLIFDFIRIPPTYFSNPHNPLNKVFVKFGWGWTCLLLSFFVIFSSYVYTGANTGLMRAHVARIVVGTGFWYTVTGFLNYVLDMTGRCHPSSVLVDGKRPMHHTQCRSVGGVWYGFDISGHCFLLVMANLWILEELRCMQYWNRLSDLLKPYESNQNAESSSTGFRNVDANQLRTMRSAFRRLTGPVRILFSLTASISMLWDFMFLITIIYFHTMPTKLIGTLIATTCWFVSYRVVFPSAKTGAWGGMAPGMPGDGPINFVPR